MPNRSLSPKGANCDKCANDFMSLDFENAVKLISELHKHKLSYESFYLTVVASIGSISIALFNIGIRTNTKLDMSSIAELFLILSGTIGLVVIRRLASIRKNEVYLLNLAYTVRKTYIKRFKFKDYPQFTEVYAYDRSSTDYTTIICFSIINCIMYFAALYFLLTKFVPWFILLPFVIALYFVAHYHFIESYLKPKDQNKDDVSHEFQVREIKAGHKQVSSAKERNDGIIETMNINRLLNLYEKIILLILVGVTI